MKLTTIAALAAVLMFGLATMVVAETLKLTGVSGESSGGESIGPYFVTVDGVTTMVVCDDLFIQVNMGQTWEARKLGWEDLPASDRPLYGTAYWLVSNILNTPGPHALDQSALWFIFAPTRAPILPRMILPLQWAITRYVTQPDYAGYQNLEIWRPTPGESSQEMLGLSGGGVETPEPASVAYVIVGLGAVAAARVRVRRGGVK